MVTPEEDFERLSEKIRRKGAVDNESFEKIWKEYMDPSLTTKRQRVELKKIVKARILGNASDFSDKQLKESKRKRIVIVENKEIGESYIFTGFVNKKKVPVRRIDTARGVKYVDQRGKFAAVRFFDYKGTQKGKTVKARKIEIKGGLRRYIGENGRYVSVK